MQNSKNPAPVQQQRSVADAERQETPGQQLWRQCVEGPIIRFRELLSITQVGRSKAYLLMNSKSSEFDPDYPTGFRLFDSPRSPKAFYRHEAIAWIEGRVNKQRQFHKENVA